MEAQQSVGRTECKFNGMWLTISLIVVSFPVHTNLYGSNRAQQIAVRLGIRTEMLKALCHLACLVYIDHYMYEDGHFDMHVANV